MPIVRRNADETGGALFRGPFLKVSSNEGSTRFGTPETVVVAAFLGVDEPPMLLLDGVGELSLPRALLTFSRIESESVIGLAGGFLQLL